MEHITATELTADAAPIVPLPGLGGMGRLVIPDLHGPGRLG